MATATIAVEVRIRRTWLLPVLPRLLWLLARIVGPERAAAIGQRALGLVVLECRTGRQWKRLGSVGDHARLTACEEC